MFYHFCFARCHFRPFRCISVSTSQHFLPSWLPDLFFCCPTALAQSLFPCESADFVVSCFIPVVRHLLMAFTRSTFPPLPHPLSCSQVMVVSRQTAPLACRFLFVSLVRHPSGLTPHASTCSCHQSSSQAGSHFYATLDICIDIY